MVFGKRHAVSLGCAYFSHTFSFKVWYWTNF